MNKKGLIWATPIFLFLLRKAIGLLMIGLAGFIVWNEYKASGFSTSFFYAVGMALALVMAGLYITVFFIFGRLENEKWSEV